MEPARRSTQAEAAGISPTVHMNPILLKPEGDARSQVVVLGKPVGSMSAVEYHARKPELRALIAECLVRLRGFVHGGDGGNSFNVSDRANSRGTLTLDGGSRGDTFNASGLEMLWRTLLFAVACAFLIPIPWVLRWYTGWYVSQFALVEREA